MIRTNKILLLLLLILCITSQAQTKRYLEIEVNSTVVKHVKNFSKFYFRDSLKNDIYGKISILNDSEFCFVNFFYERSSRTYHVNEIKEIYLANTIKRKISPLAVVGICFIPGGIYYLIIREIIRQIDGPNKVGVTGGWRNSNAFKIRIKSQSTSATDV